MLRDLFVEVALFCVASALVFALSLLIVRLFCAFGRFLRKIPGFFWLLSVAMFEKQVFGKSITSGRRLLQEEIELSFYLCLDLRARMI